MRTSAILFLVTVGLIACPAVGAQTLGSYPLVDRGYPYLTYRGHGVSLGDSQEEIVRLLGEPSATTPSGSMRYDRMLLSFDQAKKLNHLVVTNFADLPEASEEDLYSYRPLPEDEVDGNYALKGTVFLGETKKRIEETFGDPLGSYQSKDRSGGNIRYYFLHPEPCAMVCEYDRADRIMNVMISTGY